MAKKPKVPRHIAELPAMIESLTAELDKVQEPSAPDDLTSIAVGYTTTGLVVVTLGRPMDQLVFKPAGVEALATALLHFAALARTVVPQ